MERFEGETELTWSWIAARGGYTPGLSRHSTGTQRVGSEH